MTLVRFVNVFIYMSFLILMGHASFVFAGSQTDDNEIRDDVGKNPSLPVTDKALYNQLDLELNNEVAKGNKVTPCRLSLLPRELLQNFVLPFLDIHSLLAFRKAYGRYTTEVEEILFARVIPWVRENWEEVNDDEMFFADNFWTTWDSLQNDNSHRERKLEDLSRCIDVYIFYNSWLASEDSSGFMCDYWESLNKGDFYKAYGHEKKKNIAKNRLLLRNMPFLSTPEMSEEIDEFNRGPWGFHNCPKEPHHLSQIVTEAQKLDRLELSKRAQNLRLYRNIVLCPTQLNEQEADAQMEIIAWALQHPAPEFENRALVMRKHRQTFLEILNLAGVSSWAYCLLLSSALELSVDSFETNAVTISSHRDFFTPTEQEQEKPCELWGRDRNRIIYSTLEAALLCPSSHLETAFLSMENLKTTSRDFWERMRIATAKFQTIRKEI